VSEDRDRGKVAEAARQRNLQKARMFQALVVNALYAHGDDEANLDKVLDNIIERMSKDKYEPSETTIQRLSQESFTPRMERALRSSPVPLRPEIEKLFPQRRLDQMDNR
jgi:hypothetical protein